MYAFDYQRPASRDAAKTSGAGADTRFLAGGQSLIQAMRLRLSQSARLVDLGAVADLKTIKADGNGVTIGAMATHAAVAASADVKRIVPALAELAGGIGDPMVRNMGTIGGSIANADPAACYPAGLLALNATIHTDRRTIAADAFFTGLYETALQPGELITAVSFPAVQKAAYIKYKQPASRFALVPGPASVDEVLTLLGAENYVCDRRLATAVFLGLSLQRPLFLEGEPGVGKTELARRWRRR